MSLETGTYINSLVPTNPPGSDPIAQADDHIRLIKSVLKATFPSITGPITVSDTQINEAVLNGGGGSGGSGSGGTTNVYTGVDFVSQLPAAGDYVGQLVFLTTDNTMYSWDGAQWVAVALTPDTPEGIAIVDSLATPVPPNGTTVLLRSTNKLMTVVNGAWTELVVTQNVAQEVADASITVAKFAQGIRPIEVVDNLPTTNNVNGRMVFLTTDDKLYRYDGQQFVSSVAAGDLTGEITADQIAANAITTGKVAAGAISANQIAAGAVNTAKLAAGAVTAEKIAVGAISADFIAANSITGDKLAANSITAGKVAAGAIGTTQLSAGAITADKLSSGQIISASAQLGSAVVGTLNIAGNAVTQAVSFQGSGDKSCYYNVATNVLTGSVTITGNQPVLVNLSLFIGGAIASGTPNTGLANVQVYVDVGGVQKTVVPGLTIPINQLVNAAGSVLFTGLSAGTKTITIKVLCDSRFGSDAGVLSRNPLVTVLETKR